MLRRGWLLVLQKEGELTEGQLCRGGCGQIAPVHGGAGALGPRVCPATQPGEGSGPHLPLQPPPPSLPPAKPTLRESTLHPLDRRGRRCLPASPATGHRLGHLVPAQPEGPSPPHKLRCRALIRAGPPAARSRLGDSGLPAGCPSDGVHSGTGRKASWRRWRRWRWWRWWRRWRCRLTGRPRSRRAGPAESTHEGPWQGPAEGSARRWLPRPADLLPRTADAPGTF